MTKKKKPQQVQQTLENLDVFPESLRGLREPLGAKYSYKNIIAEGKTGATHRLTLAANPEYSVCLKTIKGSITDSKERKSVAATLKKEVEILRTLTHRCLPSIIDYDCDHEQPYYVSSFHPGKTLSEFKAEGITLAFREAVFVIASLLDVLRYIHSEGRVHCDLHLKNVLIDRDVFRHGILIIDFGSGHRDSSSSPETENHGRVDFKPGSLMRFDRQTVNRVTAHSDFKKADFHGLANVLTQMEASFLTSASAATIDEYRQFTHDLRSERLVDWELIMDRFDLVVDPLRNVGRNSDLFISSETPANAITIPVSGAVPVGGPALSVINTPVFQRLRSLKQLSFCDWTFPGATHTRFEHSLGVFSNARQAVELLSHQSSFRSRFTPSEVRGFLLASLLHDIGHYPFAHAIEQYARAHFPNDLRVQEVARHEAHTVWILENDTELIRSICAGRNWGEDALKHALYLMRERESVLRQLLDGPMDVDKLDYLPRDAKHCGIPFGDGLDVRKAVSSLRFVSGSESFKISTKGIPSAEGFFVLQNQMLGNVYWHECVRGVFSMFHAIVEICVRSSEGDDSDLFCELVSNLRKCVSEADAINDVIIRRIDAITFPVLTDAVRVVVRELAQLILYPQYASVYVPMAVYRETDKKTAEHNVTVYSSLFRDEASASGDPKQIDWVNVKKLRAAYLEAIKSQVASVSPFDVMIDIPFGKNAMRHVEWFDDLENRELRFESLTHVGKTVFDKPAAHWSPVRVYVRPSVFEALSIDLRNGVRKIAEGKYWNSTGSDDAFEK